MKNNDFINILLQNGFEEQELIDVEGVSYNTISKNERLFTYGDISMFVETEGRKTIYLDVNSINIEGNTPKQCIQNALKQLKENYIYAKTTLLKLNAKLNKKP